MAKSARGTPAYIKSAMTSPIAPSAVSSRVGVPLPDNKARLMFAVILPTARLLTAFALLTYA